MHLASGDGQCKGAVEQRQRSTAHQKFAKKSLTGSTTNSKFEQRTNKRKPLICRGSSTVASSQLRARRLLASTPQPADGMSCCQQPGARKKIVGWCGDAVEQLNCTGAFEQFNCTGMSCCQHPVARKGSSQWRAKYEAAGGASGDLFPKSTCDQGGHRLACQFSL